MKKLQLKKHVLTGIAYMIPVVVAGGICLGISRIFGGVDIQEGTCQTECRHRVGQPEFRAGTHHRAYHAGYAGRREDLPAALGR